MRADLTWNGRVVFDVALPLQEKEAAAVTKAALKVLRAEAESRGFAVVVVWEVSVVHSAESEASVLDQRRNSRGSLRQRSQSAPTKLRLSTP